MKIRNFPARVTFLASVLGRIVTLRVGDGHDVAGSLFRRCDLLQSKREAIL